MSQEVDEAIVTKVDEAETDGTGSLFYNNEVSIFILM